MTAFASPDTRNYQVGKGKLSFKKEGEAEFRLLGNVAEFELEFEVEDLEHFSAMEGLRTKDLVVAIELSAVARMVMEEFTADNLAIALLGETSENSEGSTQITIGVASLVKGELKFEATNKVGPKWDYHFPSVSFKPAGAISPISDEWNQLTVEGEIQAVNGSLGTATLQPTATETE